VLAVVAADDQLSDHRVVVTTDLVALHDRVIEANADARRRSVGRSFPGRGREVCGRVLGVDAVFDRVAVDFYIVLGEGEFLAGGNPQLPPDDVDAGHLLANGVFDLDACVHLHEVELAVLDEELDGPGIRVPGLADALAGRLADFRAQLLVKSSAGLGASSTTFWWRRCREQSRSPRWRTFPC